MSTESDAASGGSAGMRATIERWSARPVVFLHGLPRWLLLAAVFLLLVAGMAMTGWFGAVALLVLVVALGWFAYLNWPVLDGSGKALRVVALAVLLGFAVGHALGRF